MPLRLPPDGVAFGERADPLDDRGEIADQRVAAFASVGSATTCAVAERLARVLKHALVLWRHDDRLVADSAPEKVSLSLQLPRVEVVVGQLLADLRKFVRIKANVDVRLVPFRP